MKLFGTDGVRDLFGGEKMNPDLAFKFGAAMADFCVRRKWPLKIIIGRDTRESGPILEEAVAAGATSLGADVFMAGVIPTPGLAYLVREQQAGAGIVISASHNPAEYNGLKPFKSDGTKLSDGEEEEIEEYIADQNNFGKKTAEQEVGKKFDLAEATEKYANFLLSKIPADLKKNKLKIILDCANGATFEAAPAIFGKIAAEIEIIGANPNGKNINDNCGSQSTGNLQREVVDQRADLGLAFDGDGDRFIAIDENGKKMTGEQIIYVIAKMLKEKGRLQNDLVVTTVLSNLGFVNGLKNLDIRHATTAVGDRPVFFEMKKSGSILGGEECGHIICADYHPAGDGIVGGLMLVAALSHFGNPLSELTKELNLFPKVMVNVKVASKPDLDSVPEISEMIKKVENKLGEYGRVLVRYSGTENLCRVMIEGRDEKEIEQDAQMIAQVIKKYLA